MLASPLRRAVAFVAGCALLIGVSGSWRVPAVVPRGVEYFAPGIAASAARTQTIALDVVELVPELREAVARLGPVPELSEIGGEDAGYLVLRQALVLGGGDDSLASVQRAHNAFALGCIVAFAIAAALLTRSLVAGWAALALALVLRHALRGLLFGAVDNRTLVVCVPFLFALLVVLIGRATRRVPRPAGLLGVLAIGAAIGVIDVLRHSEGMLALYGMVVACLVTRATWWRRAIAIVLVVLGSSVPTRGTPIGVALFNDLQTGRSRESVVAYLREQPMPYHSPWHSLQIALGRYPNPEDLQYNDIDGFVKARKRYPELTEREGVYAAARAYYRWYVATYPAQWIRTLARGAFELVYYLPYATSVGAHPWAMGYLPAKAGVVPDLIEEPRDVPFDLRITPQLRNTGHGSLLNLRLPYLRLHPLEWTLFVLAVVCILAALRRARARVGDDLRVFLALLAYLAIAAVPRAIIPAHGQALISAFWSLAILAAVYLAATRDPHSSMSPRAG